MTPAPHLRRDVPLAPFTTYRIGGPADYFVEVQNQDELVAAIRFGRENNLPYFVLGTGANILIQDGGFRGLVIHNLAQQAHFNKQTLIADSGAVMADLLEMAATSSLSGLEHFAGIPSSLGGAMRQNLHFLSPDRQSTMFIAEAVESAVILDEQLQITTVDRDYFQFGYDDSILHHRQDVVLAVTLLLSPSDEAVIRRQIAENIAWRRAKQPQLDEFPSCGSVFKKIEGVGAGRLIDQVGLKGHRIGNAQISTKHANFIVNLGGATSRDVLDLVHLAQQEVKRQTGYDLEMEIGLVGEAG